MPLGFLFNRGRGRREFAAGFVHVAPGPSLSGHNRTHYWMLCLVEMPGGVFAGRRVATADVATGQALTQRNPLGAFLQAFFAGDRRARRRKVGLGEVLEMFTWLVHTLSPLALGLDGFRFAFIWLKGARLCRPESKPSRDDDSVKDGEEALCSDSQERRRDGAFENGGVIVEV